jgi:hypothetical protein
MCVVSMVHDHFSKTIEPWHERVRKFQEDAGITTGTTAVGTVTISQPPDLTELKTLIAEFRELVAAAKKIDAVTGQPDCVDPEKAKLEDRVRALEAQMEKLSKVFAS